MNRKGQIFSMLFLLIYFSFLFHDLFGHHHHLTEDVLHHKVNTAHASDQKMHDLSCLHLLENCSTCSNDDKMHEQVFLSQDYKPDLLFIIPSVRIPTTDDLHSVERIFLRDDKSVTIFCPHTKPLRGPPSLA